MKKILIFNGYYYPSKNCGGPITSIENIVNACCKEYSFYIVCYNHDFNSRVPFNVETNKWTNVGNANVMYVEHNKLDFSKKNMRVLLEGVMPDLIWFSGVLTPNNKLVAVSIAKSNNIPVLFSPRGELSADRVKLKAYKKMPYLKLLSLTKVYNESFFHGTSDDEIAGIVRFFNPDTNHIFKVANISILPQDDQVEYRKKEGELNLFFFSRIHEVKNLKFAIEVLANCKRRVNFDIYGPIESEIYWSECKKTIELLPQNIRVNYCGVISHEELNQVIQLHDAFLFPTINENYGHVIAETLANSRPVIVSKGTTPWDSLDHVAGYTISLNSPEEYSRIIDEMADMTMDQFNDLVQSTKKYFKQAIEKDSAIIGHIEMINDILKHYGK